MNFPSSRKWQVYETGSRLYAFPPIRITEVFYDARIGTCCPAGVTDLHNILRLMNVSLDFCYIRHAIILWPNCASCKGSRTCSQTMQAWLEYSINLRIGGLNPLHYEYSISLIGLDPKPLKLLRSTLFMLFNRPA